MNYRPPQFTEDDERLIFKAIRFAADRHDGHWRKGTAIPYITHLTNVMRILCEHDCPAEVIAAGVLHDVVEDTETPIQDVAEHFGDGVARLVAAATEADKLKNAGDIMNNGEPPWRKRKLQTIHHIRHEPDTFYLLVSAADKLDNIRAIRADYESIGDELWKRFNAGREDQQWYYTSLLAAFKERGLQSGGALLQMALKMELEVVAIFSRE